MRYKSIFLILLISIIAVSCSPQKKLANRFVNKSKGALVALYLPDELMKSNLRYDCYGNYIDSIAPEDRDDTIKSRIKVIDKMDDNIFLNILISSFESTLNDYGLSLAYWENENTKPDSLHWVVDISYIEIEERIENQLCWCSRDDYYNYETIPVTVLNVASWFELIDDTVDDFVFTEQNYCDNIIQCGYLIDTANNVIPDLDVEYVSVKGFYDFAVVLGKLYAGYTYDYFMNAYVRKNIKDKDKRKIMYFDNKYLRYDPYEYYIYFTDNDRLIPLKSE